VEAEPRNAASDLVRAMYSSMERSGGPDEAELVSTFGGMAPDFIEEDRRFLVAGPEAHRRNWVELFRSFWDLGKGAPRIDVGVLAVRGDRSVLYRPRVGYDDGSATEMLIALAFDSDMRPRRSVIFDSDEQDAARAELDRLHADVEAEDA
jgi:hypothetical protein